MRAPEKELDLGFTWLQLLYGMYVAGIDAARQHDELLIAVGIELVVVALLDFMWARRRSSLGVGLILTGVAAPFIGFGSASLFWYEVHWFSGDAFWMSMVLGTVVGTPLVLLGRFTLQRTVSVPTEPDPKWLTPVRYGLRGGLWVIVLAFRLGDFDTGVLLVVLGAALALTSLALGLPRRIALGKGGVGKLFLFLGGSGLIVTCVGGGASGGHMSGDEAMVGIVPSIVLMVIGVVIVIRSGRVPK